jgi:uncharacterized protein
VVLLDTNALFLPIRTGFPLEAEVARLLPGARLVVASSGIRELDRLTERRTPGASGARAFAEKFSQTPSRAEGDDAVLEVALRENAAVVTADRQLQQRLRRRGVRVLAPRDRHRLELRPAFPILAARRRMGGDRPVKPARRPRARGNG